MSGRLQFSIRFLLLATVAVAAGAAVTRAEVSNVVLLATHCLTLLFVTAAVVGVYGTTGNVRVFWIGTAIVLCPLAVYSVQTTIYILPFVQQPRGLWAAQAYYVKLWPVWCAAPINGIFSVFIYWAFSPRAHTVPLVAAEKNFSAITIRLPRPTIIALAIVPQLLLLSAVFFSGILFGERRERDRREQEEAEFERKWTLSEEIAE